MNKTLDISAFTPSQMSPEDRKGIFVQRHDLLADAVDRVKDSAETGNTHHLLFVGPRGSGKTLFVSLLVDEIDERPKLAEKLYVAWLNEDETSTTFLDLLLRIYRALSKRYPEVFDQDSMEPLYDLDSGAMEGFAINTLLDRFTNHTPLIVVENLDRIFQGIGDEGQKKLRAFLQEHPIFAIVATAQALIRDLTDRRGPFYGFFQTEHLKPLTLKDAIKLLAKIANQKQDKKLSSFLNTPKGRARARALHFLTGGNHRVFIVLGQFITHDSIINLVQPFLKMVDELTPYYQERVRTLPYLQCKIVEYLCTCTKTVPVKTIARRMLTSHQSVSSQLQDLRAKGYVKSYKKGREYLYEVSEPMMRICVEVKENQTQTLGLLVDFIRVWFEAGEITSRRGQAKVGSLDEIYYGAACERMDADGNLRHRILVDGLKSRIEKAFPEQRANEICLVLGHAPEELALATECLMDGNKPGCVKLLLVSSETIDQNILCYRGQLFEACGENAKAITDYSAVIELTDIPTDLLATALLNRGVCHALLGNSHKAIIDYTAVVELTGAPTDHLANAFINRGVRHGARGNKEKEIADYTAAVELTGASTDHVAKALIYRGVTHGVFGDLEKEIVDYTAVVDLTDAPIALVARAFLYRGSTYGVLGNSEKAIADFTALIELNDSPKDLVVMALIDRGVCHGVLGDTEKEIADFTAVVEFTSASTDQVAKALIFRGITYGELDDSKKEIVDYTAVVELTDASAEMVAKALINRGAVHCDSGDYEKEIADYTAVVELSNAPTDQVASALNNRGVTWSRKGLFDLAEHDFKSLLKLEGISSTLSSAGHLSFAELRGRQGRWGEAFEQLNEGLLHGQKEKISYVVYLGELIDILSRAGVGKASLEAHVKKVLEIATEREILVELGDSLVRHLGELKDSNDPLDSSLLGRWGEVWAEASKGISEFEIPMRMLGSGIAYLSSKGRDEALLLNLKSEERYLLRQTLRLESEDE